MTDKTEKITVRLTPEQKKAFAKALIDEGTSCQKWFEAQMEKLVRKVKKNERAG